jgi:hypothetical protein
VILRRLYLYLVSAAALTLLAAGVSFLGATVLLFVLNDSSAESSRSALAIYSAMTLVAFPVWGVHFWFAARFARRDPRERASALRRLYLYWACFGSAIGAAEALSFAISGLLGPLDGNTFDGLVTAQGAWVTIVLAAILAFHFRIAARDRAAVEETGASATLRRWYMYLALLIGTLTMLNGTSQLLQTAWWRIVTPQQPFQISAPLAFAAGQMLAGLALWGFHARVISLRHISDDRHSTLRALEGFVVVAVSIATALIGASQMLYYALAKALGVDHPGSIGNDEVVGALGAPASQFLIYGVAWFLMRRRLARDAISQEADWQAGVRRLYTNLAALVSLAAGAIGLGALLWTLAEHAEAPIIGVTAGDWRDPVSFGVTLLLVGGAVWLAHWRHAPWAADRQSLSRRLYVWAALLGSMLALIAGGVGIVYVVLQQLFSAHPALNDRANLGFGDSLAAIVVAAGVGFYHWRVLRADSAARPPKHAVAAPGAAVAHPPTPGPAETEVVSAHSRRYTLVVTDATDDDIHQALAGLPPQASYKLTSAEPAAVDGH